MGLWVESEEKTATMSTITKFVELGELPELCYFVRTLNNWLIDATTYCAQFLTINERDNERFSTDLAMIVSWTAFIGRPLKSKIIKMRRI